MREVPAAMLRRGSVLYHLGAWRTVTDLRRKQAKKGGRGTTVEITCGKWDFNFFLLQKVLVK